MSNKWNSNLTPEQNYILKEEGTEPPGSSHLNQEKEEGDYHCAGCGVKLFSFNNEVRKWFWLAIFFLVFTRCF